jgi:hypothetical protein
MFSLITGARAGITFLNSGSEAARQPAATHTVQPSNNTHIAFASFLFIAAPMIT